MGRRSWKGSRDDELDREYFLECLVQTSSRSDGPATVMQCPGLPVPGSLWNFGNDVDDWAWCRGMLEVQIHEEREGDGHVVWKTRQKFSTKPPKGNEQRRDESNCYDQAAQDPLSEPDRVSGAFTKERREAEFAFTSIAWFQGNTEQSRINAGDTTARGTPVKLRITNSAYEQIRGASAEFDELMPSITIEQNVPVLQNDKLFQYRHHVNKYPMWGVQARCVKLSGVRWQRQFYQQCYRYYTRVLEFEIDPNGFDKDVNDEGQMHLRGQWNGAGTSFTYAADANPFNPQDYIALKDRSGQPLRRLLNGIGKLATQVDGTDEGSIFIQYYAEADFMELGVPLNF